MFSNGGNIWCIIVGKRLMKKCTKMYIWKNCILYI